MAMDGCRSSVPTMKLSIKNTLAALSAVLVLNVAAVAADADNSKKNERDKAGENKTPVDQSNAPEDIKITASIRQAVVADDSLSLTAKNVKIITAAGQVVLRGPVNSAEEKTKIETLAKAVAGEAKVASQLEVKAGK